MEKIWGLVYGAKKDIIAFSKDIDLLNEYKEGRMKECFEGNYEIEEFSKKKFSCDFIFKRSLIKHSGFVFSIGELRKALEEYNEKLNSFLECKKTLEKILLNEDDMEEIECIKATISIIDKKILKHKNNNVIINYI